MPKKITKAVIAAGGWSTRFLPTVKTYAKQLVPVGDKPQIQWVMEELIGAGITEVAIVHRAGEDSLIRHFSPDPDLEEYLTKVGKSAVLDSWRFVQQKLKRLEFLPQTKDVPYGNGSPILVAEKFIDQDAFVYLWGDDLTLEKEAGKFLGGAIDLFTRFNPAVVECVQKVKWSEVPKYGTVRYVKDTKYPNRIDLLVEKVPANLAPSNIIQGGRFVVSSKILPVLRQTATSRGELWFADAVNYLAKNDVVITHNYQENDAFWLTTGDPKNWLKANLLVTKLHTT